MGAARGDGAARCLGRGVAPTAIHLADHNEPRSVNFDIADYKRRAERLRWDDLDFASFAAEPLDAETLRCIEYMHDVELHTICYLRDLLVTPAHADPDVTAFLSCWGFEEIRWLRHLWRPVGSGIMEPADTDFLVAHLFGDADGIAFTERIDRRIDRLPGLEGMGLVRGAVAARMERRLELTA
jgi:hypothetical protein